MLKKIQRKIFQLPSEFAYRGARVKHAENLPKLTPFEQSSVDALKEEGIFVTSLEDLVITSTPKLLDTATSLLHSMSTAVSTNSIDAHYINNNGVEACPNQIITNYQNLFLWGLEERLLNIAENYLGLPVAYYGVSLRIDMANGRQSGSRLWHRDGEDRRIFKIIIYLNNVSKNGGPFEYIPKSLTPSYTLLRNMYLKQFLGKESSSFSDEQLKKIVPESARKSCLGSAGTVIFADTRSILHHGKMPSSKRSALFFLYTSRHPLCPAFCKPSFDYDPDLLLALAKKLSERQRECILWNRNF